MLHSLKAGFPPLLLAVALILLCCMPCCSILWHCIALIRRALASLFATLHLSKVMAVWELLISINIYHAMASIFLCLPLLIFTFGSQDEVAWEQQEISVMGRKVMQPRLVAYMADHNGLAYTYSHTKQNVLPWAPSVRQMKVRKPYHMMHPCRHSLTRTACVDCI